MQELEETLKIKILEVDGKTQRLIFGAWTVDEKQMKIGAAECDTDREPMWRLIIPSWPPVASSTLEAIQGPLFQDYFSLLFMQYHKNEDCFLKVNNECGNVSFSVMSA